MFPCKIQYSRYSDFDEVILNIDYKDKLISIDTVKNNNESQRDYIYWKNITGLDIDLNRPGKDGIIWIETTNWQYIQIQAHHKYIVKYFDFKQIEKDDLSKENEFKIQENRFDTNIIQDKRLIKIVNESMPKWSYYIPFMNYKLRKIIQQIMIFTEISLFFWTIYQVGYIYSGLQFIYLFCFCFYTFIKTMFENIILILFQQLYQLLYQPVIPYINVLCSIFEPWFTYVNSILKYLSENVLIQKILFVEQYISNNLNLLYIQGQIAIEHIRETEQYYLKQIMMLIQVSILTHLNIGFLFEFINNFKKLCIVPVKIIINFVLLITKPIKKIISAPSIRVVKSTTKIYDYEQLSKYFKALFYPIKAVYSLFLAPFSGELGRKFKLFNYKNTKIYKVLTKKTKHV